MKLFDVSERLPIDLSSVGRPEDRDRYGDNAWGSTNCYADLAGLAARYRPRRILELGVFLGYSAGALIRGACYRPQTPSSLARLPDIFYVGLDDQSEVAGSNDLATNNIRELCRGLPYGARLVTGSISDVASLEKVAGTYDMIHVDAVHHSIGTSCSLAFAWNMLASGGVIILDDWNHPPTRNGFLLFLQTHGGQAMTVQHYPEHPTGWLLIKKEKDCGTHRIAPTDCR